MKTILLGPGYQKIVCPDDEDVTLIVPPSGLSGGLDIVGRGRNVVVTGKNGRPGDLCGWRIEVSGVIPDLRFLNLRTDLTGKPAGDVIGLDGDLGTVLIDFCRLVGVSGEQDGKHGDVVQIRKVTTRVRFLLVRRSTLGSCYQVLMSNRFPDGAGLVRVRFDRVNIIDNPSQRVQRSIAVLLKGCTGQRSRVEIVDSWLDADWAATDRSQPEAFRRTMAAAKAIWTPGDVEVVGAFQLGRPATGDICPA